METKEKKQAQQPSRLITAVIDSYERQNASVVSLLHREVLGNLTSIKLAFHLAKRNPSEFEKVLERYITATHETIKEIQIIHNELYPKLLKHVGLPKTFTSYTDECATNYSVSITLHNKTTFSSEPEIVKQYLFEKINIIRLYKAVLLNLICEQGALVLTSSISNSEKDLTIQIRVNAKQSSSIKMEDVEAFFFENKHTIDARIISLAGVVEPKTDWINYIGFTIPTNFPLEKWI